MSNGRRHCVHITAFTLWFLEPLRTQKLENSWLVGVLIPGKFHRPTLTHWTNGQRNFASGSGTCLFSLMCVFDAAVRKYLRGKDSVLQVTKDAYLTRNTSNPIAEYIDGNNTMNLTRSSPYYFISGAPGHCEKDQKSTVIVLSTKHLHSVATPAPATAPAPSLPHGNASSLDASQLATMGTLVGLGYLMM